MRQQQVLTAGKFTATFVIVLACLSSGRPWGAEAKFVTVVYSHPTPVIGRELAASFGVLGGFETGNVIKEAGKYHML